MDDTRALITELRDPGLYEDAPRSVEVRETHLSCVFLTPRHAYKLKKPVDLGFVDYTSLRKRHFMCRQEVALNRRLAPDVYLSVEPLVRSNGRLQIGGTGKVVDYLVRMRRLPDSDMLTNLLARDAVTPDQMRDVATVIARFHASADRSESHTRFGRPAAIQRNVRENFEQTVGMAGDLLSAAAYCEIRSYADDFLRSHRGRLLARAREGHIRDGHGDLRTDHVYMNDGIRIIDCIEFEPRYRYGDTASDLAFLAMDLEAHNAPDLSAALVDEYEAKSGDGITSLLNFYRCYRAYIRGKVAGLRAASAPSEAERGRARMEARRYFHIALRSARGGPQPLVLATAGITASGKSTLAAALESTLPASLSSSDVVRKSLAGIDPTEHRPSPVDAGLYSSDLTRRVYELLHDEAIRSLERGRSVILDATFLRQLDRVAIRQAARRFGADFLLIECVVEDDTAAARIEQRKLDPASTSDADWDVYLHQQRAFEAVSELDPAEHLTIDSTLSIESQVDTVIRHLERR